MHLRWLFVKVVKCLLATIVCLISLATISWADQMPRFNMHYGVTPISKDMYDLHMTVFWICVAIAILVFSILFYALIMHRKARGRKAATFHGHHTLEVIWALLPMIILIIMAIPATIVLMRMSNTDDSALTIKITGYQWKWKYSYLNEGIEFFSVLKTPLDQIDNKVAKDKWYLLEVDKPLVVPVNEKIRFVITSNDVIHSWWVPQLGVKKDAMPGFIHEAWAKIEKPGTYRGQCAELCGPYHGFMPIVIKAVSQKEFADWVQQERNLEKKEQQEQLGSATHTSIKPDSDIIEKNKTIHVSSAKTNSDNHITAEGAAARLIQQSNKSMPVDKIYTANELMEKGRANYNLFCAACHQANGQGIPPIYPALHADSVAVGGSITRHIDIVLNGIPGTAMQAFAPQLDDFQIASIITYERNAWGNRTGDVVQPLEIAKQRERFYQSKEAAEKKQAGKVLKVIKSPQESQPNSTNH